MSPEGKMCFFPKTMHSAPKPEMHYLTVAVVRGRVARCHIEFIGKTDCTFLMPEAAYGQ